MLEPVKFLNSIQIKAKVNLSQIMFLNLGRFRCDFDVFKIIGYENV